MNTRETIKSQIIGALDGATYPINTPEAFFEALPDGADTTCVAGDLKIKAGDAGKLLTADDFPVTDAESVAEKIVSRAGL